MSVVRVVYECGLWVVNRVVYVVRVPRSIGKSIG